MRSHPGLVGVVAWKPLPTNLLLVESWRELGIRVELLRPFDARSRFGAGDVALVRLDVTPTLDQLEPGLDVVARLAGRGVRILNRPSALMAAHDKLLTARRFAHAGVPHPRTLHRRSVEEVRALDPPFVLKPRFGSWGQDVMLCRDGAEVEQALAIVRERAWFHWHGVLVQELVPPVGHDLRVIVAGGRVVGGLRREAAPGEWRTNIALGGTQLKARPSSGAGALAIAAAGAVGADLVGIDLLPTGRDAYVAIEVNSAVDFEDEESLPGRSIYADLASALGLVRSHHPFVRRLAA